mmetsp:Transcript_6655/g.13852  ORF Transcript_6655/g.13852 Transcript_6655/m.13852 type:complete len:127 (-) Transcript_6655:963-1343(-)
MPFQSTSPEVFTTSTLLLSHIVCKRHIDLQQPCAIVFEYKWGKIKTYQNILMMVMNGQREQYTQTHSQVISSSTKLTPFLYLLYAYPETAETLEIPATVTTKSSKSRMSWIILGLNHSLGQLPPLS